MEALQKPQLSVSQGIHTGALTQVKSSGISGPGPHIDSGWGVSGQFSFSTTVWSV